MKLQSIIIWTFLILFSINLAVGQIPETIDVYFEEGTILPIFESELALDSLLSLMESNTDSYEILIETFPNTDKKLRSERSLVLSDLLNNYEVYADKIVHYEAVEHLYFVSKENDDWDFLRLVFIPVLLKENNQKSVESYSGNDESLKIEIANEINADYEENVVEGKNTYELKLQGGTIISISPNSFQTVEGELVTGAIVIKTKEILTLYKTVLADVTTNMDNGFLESKGMIEIYAKTPAGASLEMASGKSIEVSIPQKEPIEGEGFQIFQGTRVLNDFVDWTLEENQLKDTLLRVSKCYSWGKIGKEDLMVMKQKRKECIRSIKNKYGKKGAIPNVQKLHWKEAKLRNAECKVKEKKRRGKMKKDIYTSSNRDFSKLHDWMVYGKAKHNYLLDSTKTTYNRFSSFNIRNLGFYNIDRFNDVKSRTKILVEDNRQLCTRMLIRDRFSCLGGYFEKDKVVFEKIPANENILIIQYFGLDDDRIEFGYKFANSNQRKCVIENHCILSKEQFKEKLELVLKKLDEKS